MIGLLEHHSLKNFVDLYFSLWTENGKIQQKCTPFKEQVVLRVLLVLGSENKEFIHD